MPESFCTCGNNLESDGRKRLIFALDLHAFLASTAWCRPSDQRRPGIWRREFINDDDFAVFYDIIHIVLVERVRAQRLVDVVNQFHVRGIVQISEPKQALALADALFGQCRSAMLFISV